MSPWTRSGLFAALFVVFAPSARADIYDDAWDCASAVVDTVEVGLEIGPRALKFVATKPHCVARFGSPGTAAPMGVVVGLANLDVLPSSQPQCSAKLYSTAAQPLASGLSATLGELGVLPDEARDQLAGIASGQLAGEMLNQVPGMDEVAGSLTCGCDLVDAGLSVDTVEKVLDTGDALGDACGGVVWDTAKKVAGEIVDFAGDAADEGIRQVSNLGDALAGQTQHMPYLQYFDQHWAPRVEDFATMEFNDPGNWHDQQQWRQMWEPCVSYFDGHTQSEDTAQYTCDNMRSGGQLFPERNFGRLMYRRLFDFDVSVAVEAARKQAYGEYAAMPIDVALPAEIEADAEAMAQIDAFWGQHALGQVSGVVDSLFGLPKKESSHDGLAVHGTTPPALFEPGTVGARAQDYFAEVDANQDRADAARAVELAMADMDLPSRYREQAADAKRAYYLKYYQFVLGIREHLKDKDKEKAEAWAAQCPTQACRDQITSDYATCRADVGAWYEQNAAIIGDFDNVQGQRAGKEWSERVAACLAQARQTALDNRWHINDAGAGNGPIVVTDPGHVPGRFESRVDAVTEPEDESDERQGAGQGTARDTNRFEVRQLDPNAVQDAVLRMREQGSTGRESYSDRATRGDARQGAEDERLEARRAAREAAVSGQSGETDETSSSREVQGSDLPGCAAVRGMINPRTYVCGTEEDYQNCRRVVQGSNVRCQLGRR